MMSILSIILTFQTNVRGGGNDLVLARNLNLTLYDGRVSFCGQGETTVNNVCVCAPGYYELSGSCVMCNNHDFKAQAGNFACTPCPQHSQSFAGSDSINNCLCQKGYHSGVLDDLTCLPCTENKYKSFVGNYSCSLCPDHSVSNAASVSLQACKCDIGYTGNDGSNCAACESNTYKDSVGSESCISCPDFTKTLAVGSTHSSDCLCAEGFFLHDGSCSRCGYASYKAEIGNEECTACPVNSNSSLGGLNVQDCLCIAGFEKIVAGEECQLCEADHFCVGGSTPKEHCMTHSTAPLGSISASQCTCDASYWKFESTCMICTPNFYCPGDNNRYSCMLNSSAPAGSSDEDACVCAGGFEKTQIVG